MLTNNLVFIEILIVKLFFFFFFAEIFDIVKGTCRYCVDRRVKVCR